MRYGNNQVKAVSWKKNGINLVENPNYDVRKLFIEFFTHVKKIKIYLEVEILIKEYFPESWHKYIHNNNNVYL